MHSSSTLPFFFFYLSSRKISKSTEGWIISSGPSDTLSWNVIVPLPLLLLRRLHPTPGVCMASPAGSACSPPAPRHCCLNHSNGERCCLGRRSQNEQNRGSPQFFPSWGIGKAILQTVLFNSSGSSASSQWHTGLVCGPGLPAWAQSCPRLGFSVGNEVLWILMNFKHF